MNLTAIFVIALIVGAIVLAVQVFVKHGFSWTMMVAPVIIWVVAFLFLLIGNWMIGPMKVQATGMVNQSQDLLHQAIPDIPAVGGNSGSSGTENDGSGSGSGNSGSNDNGSQPEPTQAPPPIPPVVGETRWGGYQRPQRNDPMIPFQAACVGMDWNAWQGILLGGPSAIPYGTIITYTWEKGTLWLSAEVWKFTVQFPTNNLASFTMGPFDGYVGHPIKNALGASSVVGYGNWPLVQQRWNGTFWETPLPTVCSYP
jgi:energy-coupling factor transporter transmembrane protein EcfT